MKFKMKQKLQVDFSALCTFSDEKPQHLTHSIMCHKLGNRYETTADLILKFIYLLSGQPAECRGYKTLSQTPTVQQASTMSQYINAIARICDKDGIVSPGRLVTTSQKNAFPRDTAVLALLVGLMVSIRLFRKDG